MVDLERWKVRIQEALGNNGKVLTDVIPALELIIGKQPEVPALGAAEARNRFRLVFQNFVRAISRREHPLVIFLDDWQWADAASLSLLKNLSDTRSEDYTLIIGAYRVNEVPDTHPFMMMLEEIRKESVKIHTLSLDNLSADHVINLIQDTLQAERDQVDEFAELIYEKTRGNAFFLRQMIGSLYEENLLRFDYSTHAWAWDMEKIKAMNITDNVVDLVANKIQKLPETTQRLLKLASCIGNRFSLATLSIVEDHPARHNSEAVRETLEPARQEGLVIPLEEDYKICPRPHSASRRVADPG
ncbi:MAG: AAA family ATPase [Bacteroidia bacterium]|nr:AAA family ATPase [Bacteroidia bacterium]